MAQRALAGLRCEFAEPVVSGPARLTPRNMPVECWEIILAGASSHLRSAHTYVNWTFPPSGPCAIPNGCCTMQGSESV